MKDREDRRVIELNEILDKDLTNSFARLLLADRFDELGDDRAFGYRWLGSNNKWPRRNIYARVYSYYTIHFKVHAYTIPIVMITDYPYLTEKIIKKIQSVKSRQECEDNLALLMHQRQSEIDDLTKAFRVPDLGENVWKSISTILTVPPR